MATDTADRQRHKLNNVQAEKPVGVAFLDLGPRDCRFPLGGISAPVEWFCGEPAEAGKPYCAGHCRLAYVKPSRR